MGAQNHCKVRCHDIASPPGAPALGGGGIKKGELALPPPDSPPQGGESRPPVSGALLSHGLPPQYHRRGAA